MICLMHSPPQPPPPSSPQYAHTCTIQFLSTNMLTPDFKMKVLLRFQILMPCVPVELVYAYVKCVMKTGIVHCWGFPVVSYI